MISKTKETGRLPLALLMALLMVAGALLGLSPAAADLDPDDDPDDDGYDFDGEGWVPFPNVDEYDFGTNPFDPDTDDDEINDGWEAHYYELYPFSFNPLNASDADDDPDDDGASNLVEYLLGTDPLNPDSDGDGDGDGEDPPPLPPGPPPGTKPDDSGYGPVVDYHIFDPRLGPMKRWTAFDALYYDEGTDPNNPYTLYTYDPDSKTQIYPTGHEEYNFIFDGWIWMGIPVSTDDYTAIFSVSPDADIMSYDTNSTTIDVEFFKDGADNFFVKATDGSASGTIDLRYMMGTNGSYFTLPIPAYLTVDDVPEPIIRPMLPGGANTSVEDKVKWFLGYNESLPSLYNLWNDETGKETNMAKIVRNLSAYFLAFDGDNEPDKLDPDSGLDMYQWLAIGGKGACRHRAFLFTTTALAMGVPTRYVQNEQHAYVEVFIPDGSGNVTSGQWHQINLGGANVPTDSFPRPDDGDEDDEPGDDFRFGDNDPGDESNMTGDPVYVTLTDVEPDNGDKVTQTFTAYGHVANDTQMLPDFDVGLGLWDLEHTLPTAEVGTGTTDENGTFTIQFTVPANTLRGTNELYAASYETGFLGVSAPVEMDIYANSTLQANIPVSVGLGQELIITGSLRDIGDLVAPQEDLAFSAWRAGEFKEWLGETITDDLGNFRFNHTFTDSPTAVGNDWRIYAYFNGSAYLHPTNTSGPLNVMTSSVNLTADLEPDTVMLDQLFWVNGSVSSDAWDKGFIRVEMGGRNLIEQTPAADTWSLEINAPDDIPAGVYTVTVSFISQNPSYPDERISLEITLIGTSTLTLDDVIGVRNEELTLNGRLVDHLGSPIDGGAVTLEWRGDHLVDLVSGADGRFEHTFVVPIGEALGVLDIGALFGGDAFHTASAVNATVELSQQPLLTIDSVSPRSVFVTGTLDIEGTFTTDNGSAMDDNLWLAINGNPMGSFRASAGAFSFSYTIPDDSRWEVGQYDLEVAYKGNASRWALEVKDETTFDLMKEVRISLEGGQVHRGEAITLTGLVKDQLGHVLDGLELSAQWGDNVLPLTVITDSNGLYVFSYTIPNSELLGPITATVTFDNATNPYYVASQAQAPFIVVSELTIDPRGGKVYRNSTITITGTVVDDQGDAPDQELILNLYWDSEYIDNLQLEAGKADFSYDHFLPLDHPLGSHRFNISFTGFGWYLPAEGESNFVVWANTTTSIIQWDTPVVVGEKLTVSGKVLNDRDLGLDGNVTLNWDGGFRSLVPLVAGDFSKVLTIPLTEFAANHTLQARWPTGNYLEGSSDIVTVTVQRPTNLSVEPGLAYRDDTLTLTGHLQDHLGLRVANQPIHVLWDDIDLGSVTTNGLGDWTLEHLLPAETLLGPHTVFVTFEGSTFHLASQGRARWEVWTTTSLEYIGGTLDRIHDFNVEIRLVDDQGVGLEQRILTLTWPFLEDHNFTTDSDGSDLLVTNLPDDHPLGQFWAELNYTGEPYHHPSVKAGYYEVWANTTLSLTMEEWAMAGSQVPFNGTFTDDVGAPMSDLLKIYVNGIRAWAALVENGSFAGDYLIAPQNRSAIYPVEVVYLGSNPDFYRGTNIGFNLTVRHDSRVTLGSGVGLLNESFTLTGTLLDEVDNPLGEEQLDQLVFFWDGEPLTVDVEQVTPGHFEIDLLFALDQPVGIHSLNVSFPGDTFFNPSSTGSTVTLQGRTILVLEVLGKAVGEGALFTSQVTLTLENGEPLAEARVLVWMPRSEEFPNGTNRLLRTDADGMATFTTSNSGTNLEPMVLTATYDGDNYHLSSTSEAATVNSLAPVEDESSDIFMFVGIIGAVAAGGAVLLVHQYRQRHLRQLKQIVASTADALERGDDYNATVFESYVHLCRVLQHYGYLRKEHETAREFAQALEAALPIDHEPLHKLTRLYEVVDYSEHSVELIDRDEAIAALRAVETALTSWSQQVTVTA